MKQLQVHILLILGSLLKWNLKLLIFKAVDISKGVYKQWFQMMIDTEKPRKEA